MSLGKSLFSLTSIKVLDRVLSVVCGVLVARMLGVTDFGVYGYYFSLLAIFSMPVISGVPSLVIREMSFGFFNFDNKHTNGVFVFSRYYLWFISFISIILLIIFVDFSKAGDEKKVIFCSIGIILLRGLTRLNSAVLNSKKCFVYSSLSYEMITPLVLLVGLSYHFIYKDLNVVDVFLLQFFACLASFLFSAFFRHKFIPNLGVGSSTIHVKKWLRALIPLSVITFVSVFNSEIGVILLGYYGDVESVSILKVSMQGVMLFSLFLQISNSYFTPDIVNSYKKGNILECQRVITRGVRISSLFSVMCFIFILLFGEFFITLLFGTDYKSAYEILVMLSLSQLFNVLMGSSGYILNMLGWESDTLRTLLMSLGINVALLLIFIEPFGIYSVVISSTATVIYWNVSLAIKFRRLTHMKSWIR